MTSPDNLHELPDGLPVPEDDGACDHLVPRTRLPGVSLPSTGGGNVRLLGVWGRIVVYFYPMTGKPDLEIPAGWNEIPGARGCTPQSCAFRDHHEELTALGARVFGVSTQSPEYQREAKERLRLPFELLSDEDLFLAEALELPTFDVEGMVLIKRLTLVANEGLVEKVFYPVFPPQENASEVIQWLSRNTA